MTAFSDFFPVMRAILGDREVMGNWHYPDADLLSGLRSVFMLGRGPDGYALSPATSSATAVTPDVSFGDTFALITYEACLILIGGEDGKLAYRTRSMSVSDGGERKRDLLFELSTRIHGIREGGSFFKSVQSFAQWAGVASIEGTGCGINPAFVELEIQTGVQKLTL